MSFMAPIKIILFVDSEGVSSHLNPPSKSVFYWLISIDFYPE